MTKGAKTLAVSERASCSDSLMVAREGGGLGCRLWGDVCLYPADAEGGRPGSVDARDALLTMANLAVSVAPHWWHERRTFDVRTCFSVGKHGIAYTDEAKLEDAYPSDSLGSNRVSTEGRAYKELVLQATRAVDALGIPHIPKEMAASPGEAEAADALRRIEIRTLNPWQVSALADLKGVPPKSFQKARDRTEAVKAAMRLAEKRCWEVWPPSMEGYRAILDDLLQEVDADLVGLNGIALDCEGDPARFGHLLREALGHTSWIDETMFLTEDDLKSAKLRARASLGNDYQAITQGGCVLVSAKDLYYTSLLFYDALEIIAALGEGEESDAAFRRIRRKFHVADFFIRTPPRPTFPRRGRSYGSRRPATTRSTPHHPSRRTAAAQSSTATPSPSKGLGPPPAGTHASAAPRPSTSRAGATSMRRISTPW